MTSEDVLHDFFVPDVRVKHDIIPGRYTEIWFTPTVIGEHHATCAEYCGRATGHAGQGDGRYSGKIRRLDGDRRRRMDEAYAGGVGQDPVEQKGCQTCHNIDGTKSKGPSWKGIWGEPAKVKTSDGKEITVVVDENYVRESMMVPGRSSTGSTTLCRLFRVCCRK
jgi:cytochrome c oxidase subunit 2